MKHSSIWTEEEDMLLQQYSILYSRSWKLISLQFPAKTPKQCAYRYDKQQNINNNPNFFTKIDDITLLQLIKNGMYDWNLIQTKMPRFTIE